MISLRKTATELERLEELHRAAVKCYSQALRSTEQNAIELDTAQATHFRTQLQALRDQLRADVDASDLEAVQSSFDTELKDYRDKTRDQIQRLRQEVRAAAAAVESFAGSIDESEVNLESGLKRELNSLNQSALGNDLQEIREAIRASTAKIAASIEQMRSSNQLAIAQLKDEIRLLHQEVQAARRSQPCVSLALGVTVDAAFHPVQPVVLDARQVGLHARLALGLKLLHLGLLIGCQNLKQLVVNPRLLHSKFNLTGRLLRGKRPHFRVIVGAFFVRLELLFTLAHLLHQGLHRRMLFLQDCLDLRLLRVGEAEVVGKELHHVAAAKTKFASMHGRRWWRRGIGSLGFRDGCAEQNGQGGNKNTNTNRLHLICSY